MKFNDMFERRMLQYLGVAKRESTKRCKPAISAYMVARVIIYNEKEMSRRIFSELQLDRNAFFEMCYRRVEEMPQVSPIGLNPCLDDEVEEVVSQSVQRDGRQQIIAGSITAETMLRKIVARHKDEASEYQRSNSNSNANTNANDNTNTNANTNNPQRKGLLARYSTDWTELAREGKFTPVIGRDKEMESLERALLRKSKNNPVLTGAAGTGKTAIVEGFATKIAQGNVPQELRSKKILALNVISLLEEMRLGGFREVIDQASQLDDVILFIDEMHALPKGTLDVLKPFMARGQLRLIGATTTTEYSRFLAEDEAFARRLQKIDVGELSVDDTLRVIRGIKPQYESHHGIKIGDDAVQAAVTLSQRYMTNRFQPDKSIDLIDEAAAKLKMARKPGPVTEDDVREILSKKTGIPVEKIGEDDKAFLKNLEATLGQYILGQPQAVAAVADTVRTRRVWPDKDNRAPASFLFFGPSGVGKTALARALATTLMGTPKALIRFDMSEFQKDFASSRLIGPPPGYVGYEKGGELTNAVDARPYSVVLLDEIEKADQSVFDVFLQVLDESGRLTDSRNRVVDFSNTIIIFTSNLSESELMNDGISSRGFFRPEFMNRIDKVVHFNHLERPILMDIARKMLNEKRDELIKQDVHIEFDPSVVDYIVDSDPSFGQGARYIGHVIDQKVKKRIVKEMIDDKLRNKSARMTVVNGELELQFNHS